MQSFRRLWLLIVVLVSLASLAQNPRAVSPDDMNSPLTDADEARGRLQHEMEKKAAKDRVAAIKSDTDKLLKLTTELKADVDKSDENVLSVNVIKKAEEIEKLANSFKDKMKGPN